MSIRRVEWSILHSHPWFCLTFFLFSLPGQSVTNTTYKDNSRRQTDFSKENKDYLKKVNNSSKKVNGSSDAYLNIPMERSNGVKLPQIILPDYETEKPMRNYTIKEGREKKDSNDWFKNLKDFLGFNPVFPLSLCISGLGLFLVIRYCYCLDSDKFKYHVNGRPFPFTSTKNPRNSPAVNDVESAALEPVKGSIVAGAEEDRAEVNATERLVEKCPKYEEFASPPYNLVQL